jgi:hypothetical protein
MILSLTEEQRKFLKKITQLQYDGNCTFKHGRPILVEVTLDNDSYYEEEAEWLNEIGEQYKEWVKQENMEDLWRMA